MLVLAKSRVGPLGLHKRSVGLERLVGSVLGAIWDERQAHSHPHRINVSSTSAIERHTE